MSTPRSAFVTFLNIPGVDETWDLALLTDESPMRQELVVFAHSCQSKPPAAEAAQSAAAAPSMQLTVYLSDPWGIDTPLVLFVPPTATDADIQARIEHIQLERPNLLQVDVWHPDGIESAIKEESATPHTPDNFPGNDGNRGPRRGGAQHAGAAPAPAAASQAAARKRARAGMSPAISHPHPKYKKPAREYQSHQRNTGQKGGGQWSAEEVDELIWLVKENVEYSAEVNNKWAHINNDEAFYKRSQVDVKDKWRNLWDATNEGKEMSNFAGTLDVSSGSIRQGK
ncbi:hypothetical protein WJX73_005378 [Symbiochloris irregularis]|uniref:Myb-like domain-containing protein n=1 Tax=Symbiochloris irregularis TaxID=706552 RepID=A0AAW1NVH4_9CHLO